MTRTAPKAQLILDYEIYFGVEPPEDRVSMINNISRNSILCEIVGLNYRLKPNNEIQIDNTHETQLKELKYFSKTPELLKKYSDVVDFHTNRLGDYPNIFSRQACLFAIEEITNSDEMHNIEGFNMARIEVWESILKYLLAVNYAITKFKEEKDDNQITFESLNPKLLPLNELSIETNQIFILYRGYWLIDHFLNQTEFREEVHQYFNDLYGIEPKHFIFYLMEMYKAPNNKNSEHNFFYEVNEGQQDLFERLSQRFTNKETHKLLGIRKSPFIKLGKLKYLIADNSFLIEKAYSQFLNDFWFDKNKKIKNEDGKPKFKIEYYRGVFGLFFEKYLTQIIRKCFEGYSYSKLLLFEELKINTTKGHIEIADVYLRKGNKILLAQVKSGSIYDSEKYGGSVDSLYKKNRNEFFEKFGVNQVISSLTQMDDYIQKIDSKFPKGHAYEVYPCIIVNDKSFQTALMPDTFNTRFKELLKTWSIKKVRVKPLTIIHINDLEMLEDSINKNPKEIWDLLKYTHRDNKFAPPFHNTINHKLKERQYPERVKELYISLISRFEENKKLPPVAEPSSPNL